MQHCTQMIVVPLSLSNTGSPMKESIGMGTRAPLSDVPLKTNSHIDIMMTSQPKTYIHQVPHTHTMQLSMVWAS